MTSIYEIKKKGKIYNIYILDIGGFKLYLKCQSLLEAKQKTNCLLFIQTFNINGYFK